MPTELYRNAVHKHMLRLVHNSKTNLKCIQEKKN